MRLFSTFFHVLNTMLLRSSLKYNAHTNVYVCILNNNIVYANMCIFLYSLIQCYIVYMKHVSMVYASKSCPSHIHGSQATFFSYSLIIRYEHTIVCEHYGCS